MMSDYRELIAADELKKAVAEAQAWLEKTGHQDEFDGMIRFAREQYHREIRRIRDDNKRTALMKEMLKRRKAP